MLDKVQRARAAIRWPGPRVTICWRGMKYEHKTRVIPEGSLNDGAEEAWRHRDGKKWINETEKLTDACLVFCFILFMPFCSSFIFFKLLQPLINLLLLEEVAYIFSGVSTHFAVYRRGVVPHLRGEKKSDFRSMRGWLSASGAHWTEWMTGTI